jgi:cytochrome c553
MKSRKNVFAVCAVTFLLLSSAAVQATQDTVDELIHTALMLDSHPKRGAVVYKDHCQRCHGPTAAGHEDGAIPVLAGQRQAYLIKQFADFSQRDRDSTTMHRVISRAALNDPQTWVDVAAYLNQLAAPRSVQKGGGRNFLLGEAIFREQCSSCHDEDARGDDDGFVPALRNQHYAYLLRQMDALVQGHRRNIDPDLDLFLSSIKTDELEATADYLSRLKTPDRDRLKMNSNGVVGD